MRCWSAPQKRPTKVNPTFSKPGNQQGGAEPIYQAVHEDERCPLNIDDPGGSLSPGRRCTSQASPLAPRRTVQEPLYVAVQIQSCRSNRRMCQSEHESR